MCVYKNKFKGLPLQVVSRGQSSKFKVRIIINGKEKIVSEGTTVVRLLEELNIKPQGIAVELNLEIVPKSRYGETTLKEGDRLEIVQMVGGG